MGERTDHYLRDHNDERKKWSLGKQDYRRFGSKVPSVLTLGQIPSRKNFPLSYIELSLSEGKRWKAHTMDYPHPQKAS